jgi:hypothetical protein
MLVVEGKRLIKKGLEGGGGGGRERERERERERFNGKMGKKN